ncbi:uncharacterized protein LOC118435499 [Folsomia candida]|uniref:uncharacterized protein LOC118435499 n=1 Tax=Folsomia candida TaxID=158441 RepID=UPI0016054B27|nr:uncharacterized protein LOC118435499 [Folsomia candida]
MYLRGSSERCLLNDIDTEKQLQELLPLLQKSIKEIKNANAPPTTTATTSGQGLLLTSLGNGPPICILPSGVGLIDTKQSNPTTSVVTDFVQIQNFNSVFDNWLKIRDKRAKNVADTLAGLQAVKDASNIGRKSGMSDISSINYGIACTLLPGISSTKAGNFTKLYNTLSKKDKDNVQLRKSISSYVKYVEGCLTTEKQKQNSWMSDLKKLGSSASKEVGRAVALVTTKVKSTTPSPPGWKEHPVMKAIPQMTKDLAFQIQVQQEFLTFFQTAENLETSRFYFDAEYFPDLEPVLRPPNSDKFLFDCLLTCAPEWDSLVESVEKNLDFKHLKAAATTDINKTKAVLKRAAVQASLKHGTEKKLKLNEIREGLNFIINNAKDRKNPGRGHHVINNDVMTGHFIGIYKEPYSATN